MAGGYSRIPGYLIARLAIDSSLRGQGSGEQLLLDALGKAVAASETSIATSSPSATASVV